MLAQVEVARLVVREVLDDAAAEESVPRPAAGPGQAEDGSPIGVVTVSDRVAGMDTTMLPSGYRDIMEVLTAAGRAMRSKAVSVAMGRGESPSKVESVRVELKRLARRGWLTEDSPGLFALAADSEQTERFSPGSGG